MSLQQNVVGGRSVEGLRYERPIFEGVGGAGGGADKAPQPLMSAGLRATRVSHSKWYTYLPQMCYTIHIHY